MSDVLLDLVACETLRGSFPRGVPRRGCVRRQLELARDGKDWDPKHPGCAGCELGRQVLAEVEAAGVALDTCEKCGAAVVGTNGCEGCAAAGEVSSKAPPRVLPAGQRGPVSTVIWDPKAPDVPIAARPRHGAGLSPEDTQAAAERVRESLRHPTTVAAPPAGAVLARRIEHEDADPLPAAPRAVVGIVGGHAGLSGGTDASAARLAAPRQTTAWTAVMTDRTCRCGCGRQLRKNNTSGWSGYCNPARYSAGERPPRPSRAKESTMSCGNCGKDGHNARSCSEKKPEPKSAPPVQGGRGAKVVPLRRSRAAGKPGAVDALLARRERLVKDRKALDAELAQVDGDLGEALEREEQRVAKLREVVLGTTARAAGAE